MKNDPANAEERAISVTVGRREFILSYKEAHRADTAVLFIHGIGDSKDDFRAAWDHPSLSRYSIIAADLVGFGKSTKPTNYDYPIEDQAEALARLIEDRGYSKVHVVCHSVGGAVGVLLTELLGDKLASISSVEGNLIGADCGIISRETAASTFERYSSELWQARKDRIVARGASTVAHEAMSKEAFYKTAISVVAWSDSGKLLEKFTALTVPACYFYGDQNIDYPVLKQLKGIKTVEIPNCGHRPMDDNPGAFYRELGVFLNSLPE